MMEGVAISHHRPRPLGSLLRKSFPLLPGSGQTRETGVSPLHETGLESYSDEPLAKSRRVHRVFGSRRPSLLALRAPYSRHQLGRGGPALDGRLDFAVFDHHIVHHAAAKSSRPQSGDPLSANAG